MLLVLPPLLALLVALLRGGRFQNLSAVRLRGRFWIMLSFFIQVFLYMPGIRSATLVCHAGGVLYSAALLLLLIVCWQNHSFGWPIAIVAVGLAMNILVIIANGGSMPTDLAQLRQIGGAMFAAEIHNPQLYHNTAPAGPSTVLVQLSDRFTIHLPFVPSNVYSIGDGVLALGLALLVYRLVAQSPQHQVEMPVGS